MTSHTIDGSTIEIDAQNDVPCKRPVILVPLSGGGFLSETKDLLAALSPDFAFTYLKAPWANCPGEDGVPIGPYRKIPAFDSFTEPSVLKCGWALTATFLAASWILVHSHVDLVIVVGSRHAAPMLLAGRLFRKKTIFIESIARVNKLSRTGALVYHLHLADIFIVQWPGLLRLCPKSRLGTVL